MGAVRIKVRPTPGGVHKTTNEYDELTIVYSQENGCTFLSRQAVPSGIPITNTDYWQPYVTNENSNIITDATDGSKYRFGVENGRAFIENL